MWVRSPLSPSASANKVDPSPNPIPHLLTSQNPRPRLTNLRIITAVVYAKPAPHHTLAFLPFRSSLPFSLTSTNTGAKPFLSSPDLPLVFIPFASALDFLCSFFFVFLLSELSLRQLRRFLVKISDIKDSERAKMNCCRNQQNAGTSCEEMRKESMVCPKPRRLGRLNVSTVNDHIRPLRRPIFNCQSDVEDPSGVVQAELLDIILPKESYPDRSGSQVGFSPPYFCGSPPSRASNPVIQDEQFGNGSFNPFAITPASPSSSSSSARGCVRMSFGHKPAAVRIEGFDCLSRDRRNCSISAVA